VNAIGGADVARKAGMTKKGLQKALSAEGNPRLENMNSIMKALGYHLSPQRSEVHA
jgi:HTH-type transcriptional regulator/antitoxin HigA